MHDQVRRERRGCVEMNFHGIGSAYQQFVNYPRILHISNCEQACLGCK